MLKLLHPDEMVRLAPQLKPYLRRPDPTWPEIWDAADWLRHELDVSKSLWGEACLAMGRSEAWVAIACHRLAARPGGRLVISFGLGGLVEKLRKSEGASLKTSPASIVPRADEGDESFFVEGVDDLRPVTQAG